MAKSIYETLETLETETSVPEIKKDGVLLRKNYGMVSHKLPENILPTVEQFETPGRLLEFFQGIGKVHEALQKAVQAKIIDIRADFKAMPTEGDWSPEVGQAKVDKSEWTFVKRPGQAVNKKVDQARFNDCMSLIVTLTASKMKAEKITEAAEKIYGNEIVTACLNMIKNAKAEE
jgi:hypothetical protein